MRNWGRLTANDRNLGGVRFARPSGVEDTTILSRTINGCWFVFRWGLALSVAAALVTGGYFYLHLDDEIRRQVEQRLADHYQGLTVKVGSALFEQDRGITIRDISITNPAHPSSDQPVLAIEEIFLEGSFRLNELLSGSLPIREIVIRKPTLHAQRSTDGNWNASCLLPAPRFSDGAPAMSIEDATVFLGDDAYQGRSLKLSKLSVQLTPGSSNPSEITNQAPDRFYQIVGTAAGLPADELHFHGRLNARDGSFDLTLDVRRLAVARELLNALPIALPSALSWLDFSATADLRLHLVRQPGPQGQLAWGVASSIYDGQLAAPGLRFPVTNLSAQIEASSDQLTINDLSARWGSAMLALACNRNGWSADAPLGLALRVQNLQVDQSLSVYMPEPMARVWARFDPVGTVDGTMQLSYRDGKWQPNIRATCRSASLTDHEKFPYRVTQANGRMEYTPEDRGQPDKLLLDITGMGGGRPVTIRAELAHLTTPPSENRRGRSRMADLELAPASGHLVGYRGAETPSDDDPTRPHPTGFVEVSATAVPVNDPDLLSAIAFRSSQGGKLLASLRPQGMVDFSWRAEWQDRTQTLASTSLDLTLKDCRIVCERFPYPLQQVNGSVTERDGNWEILDVMARGPSGDTTVVCRGAASPSDAGHVVVLDFQATNAPLDEPLKQALPTGARRAWDELRPAGYINFAAHVVLDPAQPKTSIDVTLSPVDRQVSLEPRAFPYRFDAVSGVAHYADNRLEIRDFVGQHGRSRYNVREGTWSPSGEGSWQLTLRGLNVDQLELDNDLYTASPPGMQQVLARLQPRGAFALYNSTLGFSKPSENERLRSTWDINLDCHQASLAGGFPLSNITGGIHFVGKADERETFTDGELFIHSLTFQGMQFTSVRGPIYADPLVCLLGLSASAQSRERDRGKSLQALTADAYGGSLTANVRINHEDTPRFRAELSLGGADLARFATERLGGPNDLTGTASGRLSLENAGSSMQTLVGRGDLHVVNAHIYELPVLVSTLKVLKNRTPDTTAFNRCDMQFSVQGERVQFEQLQLLGDAVSLYGRGDANMDRRVDMVFHALAGPADLPIPGVSFLMRQATQQIMEIKVDGTWDKPVTKVNALPTVNNMLEQIQAEFNTNTPSLATPPDTTPARR